jgi:diguanylate cyclase
VEQARGRADGVCEAGAAAPEPLYAELRSALKANELSMVFQPIVRMCDRHRLGYEALARWWHPRTGASVPPTLFVALAEEAGLASELTRWSLQTALREFSPLYAADRNLHCALNLSARAFDDSGLSEQILAALALWDLPPQALLLEITETALLADPENNASQLTALRRLGVQVALDDFGQGYSSFGYLQFLEVGTLKIDRRFLERLHSPRERGLVQSMVELAHRLDMRAVAEGVETEDVHASLVELGCDEAQGWLYGRPHPAAHWLGGADSTDSPGPVV